MSGADTTTPRRAGWLLVATIGWIVVFSYLLLSSDPPDIGPVHFRSFEDSGHLFGSLLTGFLVFRVFERWTGRPRSAALLSLVATVAFLIGLEILQEIRPRRAYQRIDVQLNLIGAVSGVALGWALQSIRTRVRNRRANPAIEQGDDSP